MRALATDTVSVIPLADFEWTGPTGRVMDRCDLLPVTNYPVESRKTKYIKY